MSKPKETTTANKSNKDVAPANLPSKYKINYVERVDLFPIKNISDIRKFISFLQAKKIKSETKLSKSLDAVATTLEFPEQLQEEFKNKLIDEQFILKGNKFFPVRFKFLNEDDAHSIQAKIYDCISVVQKLWDKAKKQNKLDGYKQQYIGTLLGALDNLLYRIDTFKNELTSVSPNETHTIKNFMAIYSNASKLVPLDEELDENKNKDPSQKFEEVIMTLNDEQQAVVIQDFLWKYFEPKWVLNMSNDQIKKILELIISDESFTNTITPNRLNELFLRMTVDDRKNFINYIKVGLTGKERAIIIGENPE